MTFWEVVETADETQLLLLYSSQTNLETRGECCCDVVTYDDNNKCLPTPFKPHRYPRNNDPVSCTELGMLSKLSEEFDERNCNLLAIGVDSKMGHRKFIKEVQVRDQKQRPSVNTCDVEFAS